MSARVTLQARVEQYLAERRRVGFTLRTMAYGLARFAKYVQGAGHGGPLTVDLMATWAPQAKGGHGDRATSARRLKMLRPFTAWLRQFEPATEVPDEAVFGRVPGRTTPHVYRDQEIVELLAAAGQLGPPGGLRPARAPILARLDAGLDSAQIMGELAACNAAAMPQVDWLIKWNPRKTEVATLAALVQADAATCWQQPRAGKRMTVWDEQVRIEGFSQSVRRVMRLIERTIDVKGQLLIEPQLVLEGWTTSLGDKQFDAQAIITLYEGHGAHEQFHSEFKTDLDLERLPSGKFDTNALVCALAALAMNILRLLGQAGVHAPDAPVRHPAKRRRIKTVIQELIYRAARLIDHGRCRILGLGANDRSAQAFGRLHGQLAGCG